MAHAFMRAASRLISTHGQASTRVSTRHARLRAPQEPVHISLVAVGEISPDLLGGLAVELARAFRGTCHVGPETLPAGFAFDPVRAQYHSTAILQALQPMANGNRILGVTSLDLYVPVLTFVFGEAQLDGNCAVVSTYRLRNEAYGLPPNPALLRERLFKEAVHELGHTFGLRHCDDWRCVMASTHAVEYLDVKTAEFCPSCREVVYAAHSPRPSFSE